MPKIENSAILLTVFAVISFLVSLSNPVVVFALAHYFSPEEYGVLALYQMLSQSSLLVIGAMVNLIIAFLLYVEAKKAGASKWLWFLFGLTFGVYALIIQSVLVIRQQLVSKKIEQLVT